MVRHRVQGTPAKGKILDSVLLENLGRGVSAVNATEEAVAEQGQREEQIRGDEHRPKACFVLRFNGEALRACHAPAPEPAKDGDERWHE